MHVRFLSHSSFDLSDGTTTVITDPFRTRNLKPEVAAAGTSRAHVVEFGETVTL